MGNDTVHKGLERLIDGERGVSPRAYGRRLRELTRQLRAARKEPSPALALHRVNARAGLFQLEALTRVHRDVLDGDVFEGLNKRFKALEDALGAVDFHDAILRMLGEKGAKADPELRAYFLGRRAEACAATEHRLAVEGWWAEGKEGRGESEAMREVVDALRGVRWPGARKEKQKVGEYYSATATKLHERLAGGRFDLRELESGVHEIRRRMRWLSIIPASLDGLFVRPEDKPVDRALASYATPAVLASPYNRFRPRPEVPEPLVLDSSAFLALSWLIAEIGRWKDRAQVSQALAGAAGELGDDAKSAAARVLRVTGEPAPTAAVLAREVGRMVQNAVRDQVLLRLAKLGG